jgi:hypothetical protein
VKPVKKEKALKILGYVKKQQQSGKWKIVEVTENKQTGTYKTRTVYKNKTKGEADHILFLKERGIKI